MLDPTSSQGRTEGPLDLLVIGGGVSGLTLAREVVRRRTDWSVAVLEAEQRPGGTMLSDRVAGCLCEWGPNGFLTNVPHTWDLARSLGLEGSLRVASAAAARRFLWVRGELKEISANPLAFLRADILSVKGRLRVLAEPFIRRGDPRVEDSVHSFAARRIGAEAASVLVDAMVSGIHAADPARLSLRAAFPRMAEMEERHGSLTRAMIALARQRKKEGRPVGGPAGPGGSLTSFDEGMEVLIRALASALGSRLRRGVRVGGVRRVADGFEVRATSDGRDERHVARRVVIATPSHVASRLLAATLPEAASVLAEIPYAPISVACLIYDRSQIRHPLDGFGFLAPRGQGVRTLGCIWTGSIFPDHVAGDRVLLRAMVGGARDPGGAALADGPLVDLVHGELQPILGGIEGRPREVRLFRHPLGIPQYVLGHPTRIERLERALAGAPGLLLAGNAYRGIGVNDCVRVAGVLAERIVAVEPEPARPVPVVVDRSDGGRLPIR